MTKHIHRRGGLGEGEMELDLDHQRALDDMIDRLVTYCLTPESTAMLARIEELLAVVKRNEPLPLTNQEEKALAFIKKKLYRKESPSVRDVATALGFRSSRSGAKIVNNLIKKGLLIRSAHTLQSAAIT
jgi:hypothetical protein